MSGKLSMRFICGGGWRTFAAGVRAVQNVFKTQSEPFSSKESGVLLNPTFLTAGLRKYKPALNILANSLICVIQFHDIVSCISGSGR